MTEAVTQFIEQVTRLRTEGAGTELFRDVVSAARLAWAYTFDAATTGTLPPSDEERFHRALNDAMAAAGNTKDSSEFVIRLRWYQLLLQGLSSGGRTVVATLIEQTRDGLMAGRTLAAILPELTTTVELPEPVTVPAT